MAVWLAILLGALAAALVWSAGYLAALSELRGLFGGAVIEVSEETAADRIRGLLAWADTDAVVSPRKESS